MMEPRYAEPITGRTRRGVLAGLSASAGVLATSSARAAGETISERVGTTVAHADMRAFSPAVIERVTAAIEDNLATLAFTTRAARHDHFVERARTRGGAGEALVPGIGLRLPFEDAAALGAYLIHYSETDDSDFRAELRASPTVIGPAFALANAAGASGADLVAAICAGYSVLGGLAEPFGPTQDDGLMSAGVWGPAASAAVASRMLRLTAAQTANAIALAAGAAGGTFQYFYDQTEEKRLVVARAARAGVEAALLARAGEVGPRHALEGPAGLYALLSRLTGERPDYAQTPNVVARLDGPLVIYPKFFSASSSITPSLEALSPLVSNGLRSPAVERVTLRGDPARYEVVARKLTQFEVPSTLIGAKINYAFMVAFYLVHGVANAAALERARLDDRAVSELARRVRFEPVPGGAGEIVLQLRPAGSRTVTIQDIAPGSFAPLAPELRREKVRSLTQEALGASGGRIIERLARGLPTPRSSRNWIKVVDRALS